MLSRRTLPDGITIEQIVAALEAITTARVSLSGTGRKKGRDIPMHGDGLVDSSRDLMFTSITADGRQIEQLTVGRDSFQRLPASRQQATGKTWLWNPVPHHDYWARVIAAMPHIASCTGSSAEILSGEPVRRYSFLLKPQGTSLLTKLGKRSAPSVAELYTTLREQGRDRVLLDVWLASDHTLRKVRLYSAALELALLDGRTSVVALTAEYWDFGVSVDLAAPPTDQVLGYPG